MHPSDHGDEAMVSLLTAHQQRLTVFVRSMVPHRADADEVLQNVNLFIWRHAHEFTPGTDFLAWAFRIAHFEILTFRKRLARERARLCDAVVDQLAEQAQTLLPSSNLRQDALENCLERLPEKDRQLVSMRYEPEATTESVAESTGRSTKAIYEALNRIRTRLLECIDRTLAAEERAL